MSPLSFLIRRLRPAVGWPLALLTLCAALAPSMAASSGTMDPSAGVIGWAGAIGLVLGADLPRPVRSRLWRPVRAALAALLAALGGVALLAAAGQALPPLGLIAQDLTALVVRAIDPAPTGDMVWLSARFLAESLSRLWRDAMAAPNAGKAGAHLITLIIGTAGAWSGAIMLGWAVAAGRPTFGWGAPVLATTVAVAILGGGSGAGLPLAMALLLVLAVVTHMAALRRGWDRDGADHTDEVGPQAVAMGGLVVTLTLVAALAIPTSPPLWLTSWIWRDVPLPSGIAAIEAQVQRPRPESVDIGLSQLPAVDLGFSIKQGPDEQPALRISVGGPLPASPWPRYWRARVLDRYTGRSWATSARVGVSLARLNADVSLPGGIAQTVEDLRPDRQTMVGLADLVAVDVDARAERLPDGSLAALIAQPAPARYLAVSLPQELATTQPPSAPPPDLGAALSLPTGVPERVRELARTVAGDSPSPYDQALAIEHYLRGLPYSYEVTPLPPGGDAVDQFLFEMRQGYCTYYASAMAVMARSQGIPARIAVGYATGSYDAEIGRYLVREADAHAWPELYIDGRWLPFEPTPVRPLPARGSPASPVPTAAPQETAAQPISDAPLLLWLIGGALALAALAGVWLRRRRAMSPLGRALLRLQRRAARAGAPWPAGATLREYGLLIASHAAGASQLPELLARVEVATYGGQPFSYGQEARLAREIDAVSAMIRRGS